MAEQTLSTFTANIKSGELSQFLDEVDKIIIKALAESFEAQGHKLTGKLISDLSSEVTLDQGSIIVDYLGYKYGAYLNSGVPASRIPYRRGSGAGHSLYIDGLISYVKKRMMISDIGKAKSIAFAIAEKQKQVGMPIRTNGQGTKWADEAAKESLPGVEKAFENYSEDYMIKNLTTLFNEFNKK
jgi:hypothetical protein